MIPSSQGLLTTINPSHTIPSAPVVPPYNSNTQNVPAPQVLGLKLLQLHRPLLLQQSSSHSMAAQDPQHLITVNTPTFQSQAQTSQPCLDRSRGQMLSLRPSVLPAHKPAPAQSLRLHFQPAQHSSTTFPKLLLQSPSWPSTTITAPMGETSSIKLLHLDSQPKMVRSTTFTARFFKLLSLYRWNLCGIICFCHRFCPRQFLRSQLAVS